MRWLSLFCYVWVAGGLAMGFAQGAPTAGTPDPNALRHWRVILESSLTLRDMAYGNGAFVAVGSTLRHSTNELTWSQPMVFTPIGSIGGALFNGVAFGGGMFVAAGNTSGGDPFYPTMVIITSTNGINWTQNRTIGRNGDWLWDVVYGNGIFVVITRSSSAFYVSSDLGTSWTRVPQPLRDWRAVVYGGGKWVALGSTGGSPATAVSSNALDWLTSVHTNGPLLNDCTWDDGRFIAVGAGGAIAVSEDGENWSTRATPATNELMAVAAHAGQYVVGGRGVLWTSTNGLDWERIRSPSTNIAFWQLLFVENRFWGHIDYDLFRGGSAVYQSNPLNYAAPRIVQSPSSGECKLGSPTNLSALANGTFPISYQWQKNSVDIPGATNTNLVIMTMQRTDQAKYRMIARNEVGENVSAEALLTVGLPPVVVRSPLSQSVAASGAVTFSAWTEGTLPITNRWHKPGPTYVTQVVNAAAAFLHLENIQATHAGTYGVDVANKYGTSISKPARLTVLADVDEDGLPDSWETQYDLSEAGADDDRDGLTNLQEYQTGTDPKDADSCLRIDIELGGTGPEAVLTFVARSNHTYTVQASERLQGTPWTRVLDLVAASADHTVVVTNAVGSGQTFFRLVTPRAE